MKLDTAIMIFRYMYCPFIVEMLVLTVMRLYKQRRQRYFAMWLATGIVMLAAASFLLSCAAMYIINIPILGALFYAALFLMILGLLKVCYNVPFRILLFCGVSAYAMQNLSYRMGSIFEVTGVIWRFSAAVGYEAANNIVFFGIFAALLAPFWFFYVKRINRTGIENIYSRNILTISVFALGITIVLCGYANAYWFMSMELSIVNYCFAIIANIFVLVIQSGMAERTALRTDAERVRGLWQQDRRQYEMAKENIELINIKCHDLKHKLRALGTGGGASAAEIKEMEKCIAIYDSKINTGSKPLDVLLNEKSLLCNSNGIRLDCMADGALLSFMDEFDLYSLFGNMVSNAVEAALKLDDPEKKIITLTVSGSRGMVLINCDNYYSGEIKRSGANFVTDKPDDSEHGFGVKSMRLLVKKYGGTISIDYGEGIFSVRVSLPVKGGE